MFEEYLLDIGYSKEQISIISNFNPSLGSSTLLYNIKNLYNFLKQHNINNKEFINITITNPSILLEIFYQKGFVVSMNYRPLTLSIWKYYRIIKIQPGGGEYCQTAAQTYF